jgi:transcriptional regulator with XRE-family HTH domain
MAIRAETPLKRILENEGRKQSWLASRVGVDPATVWAWVHGLHDPDPDLAKLVAAALDRPVEEIFPPEVPA